MVIVIIETDFTPGEKLWMLRQVRKLVVMGRGGKLGFVRMNTGRGVDPIVAFRKRQRRGQCARSATDGKNLAYAGRLRPRQHVGSIEIEFRHIHVGVRIDYLELCGREWAV